MDHSNRYKSHSQYLNKITWKALEVMDKIPKGAEKSYVDVEKTFEELFHKFVEMREKLKLKSED